MARQLRVLGDVPRYPTEMTQQLNPYRPSGSNASAPEMHVAPETAPQSTRKRYRIAIAVVIACTPFALLCTYLAFPTVAPGSLSVLQAPQRLIRFLGFAHFLTPILAFIFSFRAASTFRGRVAIWMVSIVSLPVVNYLVSIVYYAKIGV